MGLRCSYRGFADAIQQDRTFCGLAFGSSDCFLALVVLSDMDSEMLERGKDENHCPTDLLL